MKLINAIKGLFLTLASVKIFDPREKFRAKKVAIVGPADSAFEAENGRFIDSFDYVIRINKALHSWSDDKSSFIGRKTDILFHSFFENNETGGGALDIELFRKFDVKYLINPRTHFSAYRRTFNFFRKYRRRTTVHHLPDSFYKKMIEPFGEYRPTIGYTALYSALNSECEKVYITGFTFFKTPYADGYRDHLQDVGENKKHLKSHDIHDTDLEFNLFRSLLGSAKAKNVVLDKKLNKIIEVTS